MGSSRAHYSAYFLLGLALILLLVTKSSAGPFFPKSSAITFAAVLTFPLNLQNRHVYMAFNFGSNYNLPSNDSYNEWIDRWELDEGFLGIGSGVTPIDGRSDDLQKRSISTPPRFTRHDFYRAIVSYLGQYGYNGTACLLRTICEVSATPLDEHNGVLGTIFKILFMPTTSVAERRLQHVDSLYEASDLGTSNLDCKDYEADCEHSLLDMISVLL